MRERLAGLGMIGGAFRISNRFGAAKGSILSDLATPVLTSKLEPSGSADRVG